MTKWRPVEKDTNGCGTYVSRHSRAMHIGLVRCSSTISFKRRLNDQEEAEIVV